VELNPSVDVVFCGARQPMPRNTRGCAAKLLYAETDNERQH